LFSVERIIYDTYPSGFASIFVAITILSGAILVSVGLIGEYVGRVLISLNKKPQFIIRNSFSNKKNDSN